MEGADLPGVLTRRNVIRLVNLKTAAGMVPVNPFWSRNIPLRYGRVDWVKEEGSVPVKLLPGQ